MILSFQSPTKKWHKTQPAVSTNTVCPSLQFFKGRISLAYHHYSLWSRPRSLATSGLLTGGSPGATGGSEGSNWHWEGLEGSPGPRKVRWGLNHKRSTQMPACSWRGHRLQPQSPWHDHRHFDGAPSCSICPRESSPVFRAENGA